MNKNKGDATYMDTGISMLITVVLGIFVMTLFVNLTNSSVLRGMQKSFAKDPDFTITNAIFNVRTDQTPIITLPDRSDNAEIKTFYFGRIAQDTSIDSSNHTINITVSDSTDITNLAAYFALSDKASATVNGVIQISGSSIQNFTNSVIYQVTSQSGKTVSWTVTVKKGTV